jgi:hypothetical protein
MPDDGERLREHVFSHPRTGVYLALEPSPEFYKKHPMLTWAYWCGLELDEWNRLAAMGKMIGGNPKKLDKLGSGRFSRRGGDGWFRWLAVGCSNEPKKVPADLIAADDAGGGALRALLPAVTGGVFIPESRAACDAPEITPQQLAQTTDATTDNGAAEAEAQAQAKRSRGRPSSKDRVVPAIVTAALEAERAVKNRRKIHYPLSGCAFA